MRAQAITLLALITLSFQGLLQPVPSSGSGGDQSNSLTDAQIQAIVDQHEPDPRWWVNAANTLHHFSSRRWLHQEDLKEDSTLSRGFARRRDGRPYDSRVIGGIQPGSAQHNATNRLSEVLSSEVPRIKVGPIVEGVGEFADIAALTSSKSGVVRLANSLSFLARSADVVLGSFPQLVIDYDDHAPTPRFWGTAWKEKSHLREVVPIYLGVHLVNQLGKAWDMLRASNRIKNAPLIAWYNKTKLSKKKLWYLRTMQLIHTIVLIGSMVAKSKVGKKNGCERYPYLIAEAVISLLRRLHMRHLQSKMLDDARDEWAVENDSTLDHGKNTADAALPNSVEESLTRAPIRGAPEQSIVASVAGLTK